MFRKLNSLGSTRKTHFQQILHEGGGTEKFNFDEVLKEKKNENFHF